MKKKITLTVLGLSLATSLVVGGVVSGEEDSSTHRIMNSDSMSTMMNNNSTSNMRKSMEDSDMNKMMDAMDTPEGKEMIKNCSELMDSYQDKEGYKGN